MGWLSSVTCPTDQCCLWYYRCCVWSAQFYCLLKQSDQNIVWFRSTHWLSVKNNEDISELFFCVLWLRDSQLFIIPDTTTLLLRRYIQPDIHHSEYKDSDDNYPLLGHCCLQLPRLWCDLASSVCCWYKIVAQPSPAVPPRYQHQHTFPVPQSHSLTVLSSVPAAATALIRPRHQENPVCLPGRLFSPDWQPRGCGGNNILYHTTSLNTSYQPECNGETFPSPTLCKVGGWEY